MAKVKSSKEKSVNPVDNNEVNILKGKAEMMSSFNLVEDDIMMLNERGTHSVITNNKLVLMECLVEEQKIQVTTIDLKKYLFNVLAELNRRREDKHLLCNASQFIVSGEIARAINIKDVRSLPRSLRALEGIETEVFHFKNEDGFQFIFFNAWKEAIAGAQKNMTMDVLDMYCQVHFNGEAHVDEFQCHPTDFVDYWDFFVSHKDDMDGIEDMDFEIYYCYSDYSDTADCGFRFSKSDLSDITIY